MNNNIEELTKYYTMAKLCTIVLFVLNIVFILGSYPVIPGLHEWTVPVILTISLLISSEITLELKKKLPKEN